MIKKQLISILLFLTCFSYSYGQTSQDSISIRIWVNSPGAALYEAFGHSSIRVINFSTRTDVLYNYGIFDFNTPNFYWKFLKGKLDYQLGVESTRAVYNYYERRADKIITEQELLLSQEELHKVYDFLKWNAKGDNKYYRYDFFFDNCASRIRDILEKELPTPISYEQCESYNAEKKPFRELLNEHMHNRTWEDLGIDIIMGLPTDKTASFREEMFLPIYIKNNLSCTQYNGKPLLSDATIVINGDLYEAPALGIRTPFVIFSIICAIVMLLTFLFSSKSYMKQFDNFLFGLLGIIGCFLMFMWLGTEHSVTKYNLNILWANPLYLFFIYNFIKNKKMALYIVYGMAALGGLFLLITWGRIQEINIGLFPFILMILIRTASGWFELNRKKSRFE